MGALLVKSPVLENIHVHVLFFMLTLIPPVTMSSALMAAYFQKILDGLYCKQFGPRAVWSGFILFAFIKKI